MTIRHKSKKASLSTGYVSEWNDDHHADFEDELLYDYNFVSTIIPDELSVVEANNGTVTIGMVDNHNFCNIVSSVTANGLAVLKLGTADVTNKLNLPIFTTALKLETGEQIEFGFFVHDDTPFTANQKGAYFRVAGDKLYAVTGSGAAETVTEIGDITEYSQYKIEFTSIDVKFYTEDLRTIRASHSTNIPTDDLTIKISAKVSDATSQIVRVDGLALMRLRKK